ncbi:MAG: AI-2E family transporter [Lachnospiraceae bacterium]|nr:AI-2E family transporter [Lachnospiraceae bacterium]MDD7628232.1 AI-2E family transporter [Lachnospiraceae bacterium]MDY4118221.1 AI-2E family transporter [Lachnospiraceae bacterium]
MKINIDKKHISLGITSFLVVASSICFYYLLFHGDRFLGKINAILVIASPVIYGIILAYLLTPIVNTIEKKLLSPLFTKSSEMNSTKKKWMRFLSVLMTVIIVILFIYGFFSILIPNVISSVKSISFAFPIYVNNLMHFADKYFEANPDIEALFNQLVSTYSVEIDKYLNNTIIPQMESLLKTVSLSLISVLKAMWNLIIGLIISIYVLCSKEIFAGQSKKIIYAIFSTKTANSLIKDFRFISDTFIGFISGKIVDSIIIGIICFIGTSLLKIPYALLVSVIVGITNIIPFFGPYLGAIPSAILILMINPIKCITFIIFILILQQVDGNVIGPKILGQSTGLSGFWVIFSITIFGGLFGFLGMIIGVPFFAVVYAMTRRIIDRMLKKRNLPISTSEYMDLDHIDENNENTFIEKNNNETKRFFKISFKKKPSQQENESKNNSEGE